MVHTGESGQSQVPGRGDSGQTLSPGHACGPQDSVLPQEASGEEWLDSEAGSSSEVARSKLPGNSVSSAEVLCREETQGSGAGQECYSVLEIKRKWYCYL